MSAPSATRPGPAEDDAAAPGRRRLRAYLACLLAAFALYLAVHGAWSRPSFLVAGALAAGGLALPLLGSLPRGNGGGLLAAACLLAGGLVLVQPLGVMVLDGVPLPAAVAASPPWPQILVLLFAGRVLAEQADLRFAAFWRDPLTAGRAQTQSMAAALLLGCCLTLVFYLFAGGVAVAPERLDPWAVALRALTGKTAIHVAIVLLFFVVVAALADAALLLAADRMALGDLRRLCRRDVAAGRAPDPAAIAAQLPHAAHSRTVRLVAEASRSGAAGPRALDAFHLASRRLIRALISFLPLLGFLGTVIGLTAAIGGLPSEIGPQAAGGIDISASLLGLALKFETTLLGLAGALAASLLLALLEKREEELAAQCRHLVEAHGYGA